MWFLSSKISRIRGNGGQGLSHSPTVGQRLISSLQLDKDVLPTYSPPPPNTDGDKEPGKAHSTVNRFGESGRNEGEEGFWQRQRLWY